MSTVKGQEISSDPTAMPMTSLEIMLRLSLARAELAGLADIANSETATIIRYAVRVLNLIGGAKCQASGASCPTSPMEPHH